MTLNDVTYVEAARSLAERVLEAEKSTTGSRIDLAFRLATSRRASQREREILVARYEELKQQYAVEPEEASKLLDHGQSDRNQELEEVEHAAFTNLCVLLLNLDESLSK